MTRRPRLRHQRLPEEQYGQSYAKGVDWEIVTVYLYSPSQPRRGDQAGSAHTVKAPAFPIPSGGEGLVYSLRWCWDQ